MYFASVGNSVRDSRKENSMDNITASAIGTNRYRGTPSRKYIGTKTTQIHNSETNAGTAICPAPSKMAFSTGLPCSR